MNTSSSPFRGFTLIELLVVIAIIGILSSVVLASLGNARTRSADAATKSNLATIRSQAEIYHTNNNNSYGSTAAACGGAGTLFSDPIISRAIVAANDSSGGISRCGSNANAWAVSTPLKSVTGNWCVDSTGIARVISSPLTAGNTVCPSS